MNSTVETAYGQAITRSALSAAFLTNGKLTRLARYLSALEVVSTAITKAFFSNLGDSRCVVLLIAVLAWRSCWYSNDATLLVRVIGVQRLHYHGEARILGLENGNVRHGHVLW